MSRAPGSRGGKVRSAPDISADADPFTGIAVGLLNFDSNGNPTSFFLTDIGGTSESSPLVGGIVMAAQQGHRRFGFLNPALYKLHSTAALHEPLPVNSRSNPLFRGTLCGATFCGAELLTTFDDQSSGMIGYTGQVTVKGYNNMTGVGTPHGQIFINDMRKLEK
jgi:subtilase family serine protease